MRIPATMEYRRVRDADLPLLTEWLSATHVQRWFPNHPKDVLTARQRYAESIADRSPLRMWVALGDGYPIGYLQDYRVRDYDDLAVRVQRLDAVALDYLIADPGHTGHGLGTRMVSRFLNGVLLRDHPDAGRFVAAPDHRNRASLRLLEKVGFTRGLWIQLPGDDALRIVCTIRREAVESDLRRG